MSPNRTHPKRGRTREMKPMSKDLDLVTRQVDRKDIAAYLANEGTDR